MWAAPNAGGCGSTSYQGAKCQLTTLVWLRDDESAEGFQFCYDKDDREHVLTWTHDFGFSHMRVDSVSHKLKELAENSGEV